MEDACMELQKVRPLTLRYLSCPYEFVDDARGSADCSCALHICMHARTLARTHSQPPTSTHGPVPPRPCVLHRDHNMRDRLVWVPEFEHQSMDALSSPARRAALVESSRFCAPGEAAQVHTHSALMHGTGTLRCPSVIPSSTVP